MKVAAIIYNILKSDASITGYVSDRIYPLVAPQNVVTPFIIHVQTGNSPYDSKTGPSTMDVAMATVIIIHENMDTVEDIAEAARTALDRYSGNISGIDVVSVQYIDEKPGFDMETGWYSKELDFRIMAKR